VRAPRPSTLVSAVSPLCVSSRNVPLRRRAALLAFAVFFAVVFVFPISLPAENWGPITSTSSTAPVVGSGSASTRGALGSGLTNREICLLLPLAFLFALLGLLKDFHRYRGLLHVLIWNFHSWLYLCFTATCIFTVDYYAFLGLEKITSMEGFMRHVSLALGHTGVSAAFAYTSPFLLSVFPAQIRTLPEEPAAKQPEREKPTTEMNVVYAEIQDSLETCVNCKVNDWTDKYSWPVIRFTGKMLLTDRLRPGMLSQERFDSAIQQEGCYEECTDFWENRQRKYDLLRIMMTHSSYHQLSYRLARTAQSENRGMPA